MKGLGEQGVVHLRRGSKSRRPVKLVDGRQAPGDGCDRAGRGSGLGEMGDVGRRGGRQWALLLAGSRLAPGRAGSPKLASRGTVSDFSGDLRGDRNRRRSGPGRQFGFSPERHRNSGLPSNGTRNR